MQKDIHYYGTYAVARAAGIPEKDAQTIAYAAQFVDDSTRYDSKEHDDGGLLFGITTAHHPAQSLIRSPADHANSKEEQRKIWVPFHFFPGGAGNTFYEKILCVKDSKLVNEMLDNHLNIGKEKEYFLELMGICAHVYMDTFSHYGFSGLSSRYNEVKDGSLDYIQPPHKAIADYIGEKFEKFKETFCGIGAQGLSLALGHAGAATYPDRPYLHWKCEFVLPRPSNGKVSDRDNPKTFLQACEKLHSFFRKVAQARYAESDHTSFDDIKDTIKEILSKEADESSRCNAWAESGLCGNLNKYCPTQWENDKNKFGSLSSSTAGVSTNIYRFHQAAAYHRYYTLKDLLPKHGIAVY